MNLNFIDLKNYCLLLNLLLILLILNVYNFFFFYKFNTILFCIRIKFIIDFLYNYKMRIW